MTPQPDQMRANELPLVLDWAAKEGWNPGLNDAAAFYATDPDGFFVSRDGDQPVAAISVVNHDTDIAFLGLYICLPNWRGKGVGRALWDHAIQHAGKRTIGLDAVPAQQANYVKSGFEAVSATTRFSGAIASQIGDLKEAQPADMTWMVDLDRIANGYAKPAFLQEWCCQSDSRKTFVLEGAEGFATIRQCSSGAKIGPLVARNEDAAKTLMLGVANTFDGPTTIDLPADNAPLTKLCEDFGMTSDFTTTRMYRGAPPKPGLTHRAIATLELG